MSFKNKQTEKFTQMKKLSGLHFYLLLFFFFLYFFFPSLDMLSPIKFKYKRTMLLLHALYFVYMLYVFWFCLVIVISCDITIVCF